jgi:predicted CXXCH cytochrome family protein
MSLLAFIFMMMLQTQAQPAPPAGPLVGSVSCKGCHETEYSRWSDSIHGRMIQRANRTSVVSNIDLAGGPSTSKMWRDGVLYITENGVENKIDYTLGNRRIQHYLTTRPNGEIHVLHTSWDVKRHEWFDSKDIVQSAPTGFIQQWNTSCVYCHVTQQVQDVKGFNPKTLEYKTSWVESSATCERCHGPMSEHAEAGAAAPLIPTSSFERLVTCAQCHWPKTVVATGFNMQKPYFDYYSPALMHLEEPTVDPNWWADGRPRRFSNEAAAFFLSGCFQSGQTSCMNCHDPHWNRTDGNDQLLKNADQYCIKCHEGLKAATHTHHGDSSAGSSCVGCHMPHAVQGVKATMRDHSMSFPEPENTVRYGIPNACNECHADKSPEWALDNVEAWYPNRSSRPRLRATAFSLAKKNDPRAVNALIRLANDKTENPAIRATAVGFIGRFSSETSNAMLIAMTKDKEPLVRIEAARGLGGMPSENSAVALAGLLDDPYLSVRVRAVSSLTSPLYPAMTFSPAKQVSFDRAVDEFRRSLELEGDHPNVQVRLGNLESTLGNRLQAREAFQRALKINPGEADAYVGLAIMDLEIGNKADAIRNARHAVDVSSGKEAYKKFLEKLEAGQ